METESDEFDKFERKVVPKRQLIITEQIEEDLLGIYPMEISASEISRITRKYAPSGEFNDRADLYMHA